MCSLPYGHPGRDAMLSIVSDIWWPRIGDRDVIDQARLCEQCLESGNNIKGIQSQGKTGNIPRTKEQIRKWHLISPDASKTRGKEISIY